MKKNTTTEATATATATKAQATTKAATITKGASTMKKTTVTRATMKAAQAQAQEAAQAAKAANDAAQAAAQAADEAAQAADANMNDAALDAAAAQATEAAKAAIETAAQATKAADEAQAKADAAQAAHEAAKEAAKVDAEAAAREAEKAEELKALAAKKAKAQAEAAARNAAAITPTLALWGAKPQWMTANRELTKRAVSFVESTYTNMFLSSCAAQLKTQLAATTAAAVQAAQAKLDSEKASFMEVNADGRDVVKAGAYETAWKAREAYAAAVQAAQNIETEARAKIDESVKAAKKDVKFARVAVDTKFASSYAEAMKEAHAANRRTKVEEAVETWFEGYGVQVDAAHNSFTKHLCDELCGFRTDKRKFVGTGGRDAEVYGVKDPITTMFLHIVPSMVAGGLLTPRKVESSVAKYFLAKAAGTKAEAFKLTHNDIDVIVRALKQDAARVNEAQADAQ